MATVGYLAAPDDKAALLIGEARQRQRRRWASAAVVVALAVALGIFFLIGRGSGSGGGRPTAAALPRSAPATVTRATRRPTFVSGAMTIDYNAQRRTGQAIRPLVSDSGLLINRGRRPVYISGRPLILALEPLLPHGRVGNPTYYILRAHGPFHFAGLAMSGSRSVFVVASTKRPPTSFRNVPGRKIAVWYTLDGGSHWETNIQTITTASYATLLTTAMPAVQGADEKTAITRLLARGLVPEIHVVHCAGCGSQGRVLKQSSAPGQRLTRWSQVRIDVSG
jgi:hypothetical protein